MLTGFASFLVRIILDQAPFDAAQHFCPFVEAMEKQKLDLPQAAQLIRKLGAMKVDSDTPLDASGVNLETRTRFWSCYLWKDFMTQRHRLCDPPDSQYFQHFEIFEVFTIFKSFQ